MNSRNEITLYSAKNNAMGHIEHITTKYHDGRIFDVMATGIGTYIYDGRVIETLAGALVLVQQDARKTARHDR